MRGGARRAVRRDSFCRPCRAEYKRKHYLANRERYLGNAHATKRRLRFERTEFLIDYFATHPCFDCGEDPVVLEFDHLHDKEFAIGTDLCRRPWLAILAEIEKCEVVCAKLPPSAHSSTQRGNPRGLERGALKRAAGIEPVSESLEGSRATITPRPREPGA